MWFGTKALRAVGRTTAISAAQRRAAAFLLGKQRRDGGWGESYLSCQNKEYSHLDGARLALLACACTMIPRQKALGQPALHAPCSLCRRTMPLLFEPFVCVKSCAAAWKVHAAQL
jgi:Prenyltransferase and squalene oxidase repeat